MYIIHIETSTRVCSVALSSGRRLLAWEDHINDPNHSALLPLAIRRVLEKGGIGTKDLGAVSVSSGPGSYTGLRIGSSTAKAMAYSLGIPLIAVPTLYALAVQALEKYPQAALALPMLDARRQEVYTALYDRACSEVWPVRFAILDKEPIPELLPEQVTVVVCGDGSAKFSATVEGNPRFIVDTGLVCSARYLANPAFKRYEAAQTEDALHFVPYYLKPPNITIPKTDA